MSLLSRSARVMLTWAAATSLAVGIGAAILVSEADAAATTYVTTANLNVRKSASTKSGIVTTLKKGTKVSAAGSISKGWLPITYKSKKYYVSADYLKVNKTTSTAKTTLKVTATYVTTANLNVRKSASTKAGIVTTLKKGTKVSAVGKVSKGWLPISYKNKKYYVSADYLKVQKTTTPAKPSATPTVKPTAKPTVKPTTTPTAKPTATPTAKPVAPKTTATTKVHANLRAKASLASDILKVVKQGTKVKIGATSGSFTAVTYDGTNGFILTEYLN